MRFGVFHRKGRAEVAGSVASLAAPRRERLGYRLRARPTRAEQPDTGGHESRGSELSALAALVPRNPLGPSFSATHSGLGNSRNSFQKRFARASDHCVNSSAEDVLMS
jgi:hypothetical protein